ncbi:AraC family transcriptional regulator ligand-binding domain-containing protein [Pseudomonas sp. NPDC088444]|uniref:AraC family transcriptional regulator n=1 Tax=Pseudomonas sp. NPDC088444 TaxID=3364456 RepID=UPI00384A9947
MGLELGSQLKPDQLGTLGLLMTITPTLREALTRFTLWVDALQEGSQTLFEQNASPAQLIYRVENTHIEAARHDVEYTIANTCNFIRARMGQSWIPVEVTFEHTALVSKRIYEKIFRCPVRFTQSVNSILISHQDLDCAAARPGSWRERAMLPMLDQHLQSLQREVDDQGSFTKQVSAYIFQNLGTTPVNLASAAKALKTSVRTLQRRLELEGANFRDIVQRERQRKIDGLLQDKHQSLLTVAGAAGYSDATALSRAFRKWTGTSPKRAQSKPSQRDEA